MFDDMRFEHSFVNLVLGLIAAEREMNLYLPLSWTPYGIPHNTLIRIGIAFEGGRFRGLRPRQRAIKTALELIETYLVPYDGKFSLFLAARRHILKHQETAFSTDLEQRAKTYLDMSGLSG